MLPQQQRRRRRRAVPRAAERRVTVVRGPGGFGFTIAGQRPCVVSAVAAGGPADAAGLRPGDALLAVDGASVARAAHAAVARLVAAAPAAIALSVAPREPPTDTEDTEPEQRARSRRRHPPPRRRLQPQGHAAGGASCSAPRPAHVNPLRPAAVECRALVGYLGTIESPPAHSDNPPQSVRTAVRKLRQERRPAAPVLLTVLPRALALRRPGGRPLAQYARERVVFAGCSSDADRRYFGLVTAAEVSAGEVSHSCHVFSVDARLAEHAAHAARAREFDVACTRDPVSERCLEFPPSAEYVVGVIKGMYSLPAGDCASPALQQLSKLAVKGDSPLVGNFCRHAALRVRRQREDELLANSPQPSNHSEVTTTSSNSDSGIGFHNDGRGIADRILVVEFAQPPAPRARAGAGAGARAGAGAGARPRGLPGADAAFLSNTTPVVDGFGGQGRPLNPLDDVVFSAGDFQARYRDEDFNYNGFGPSTSRGRGRYEFETPHVLDADELDVDVDDVDLDGVDVEVFEERACGSRSAEPQLSDQLSLDSLSACSSRYRPADSADEGGRPRHDDDNFVHPASVKFKVKKNKSTLLAKTRGMFSRRSRLSASAEDVCAPAPVAPAPAAPASEPDLRSEQASPFRRWTSGGSSYRRECRPAYNTQTMSGGREGGEGGGEGGGREGGEGGGGGGEGGGGVARWALGLEHLLSDPAGAAAFTHFLTNEFAAENIRFWFSCEQYRAAGRDERARLAAALWRRHLADAAPEPVNVDAAARRAAARARDRAGDGGGGGGDEEGGEGFELAQKQIFNVLKFDSYPRFLRSRVHAECARAELCGLPCPYLPRDAKLKKSDSSASERRRSGGASLLPWRLRPGKERHSASLTDVAAAAAAGDHGREREREREREAERDSEADPPPAPASLCRVILPDASTSVVGLQGSEPVGRLLTRLLQRRRLPPASYDVIVQQADPKLIDPSAPSTVLAGRTARVERRVTVRVELRAGAGAAGAGAARGVRVRCAPGRSVREALAPLVRADAGRAVVLADGGPVSPDSTVEEFDGGRLQIVMLSDDDTSVPAHLVLTPAPAAPAPSAAPSTAPSAAPDAAARLVDDGDAKSVSGASGGRVRASLRPGPALQHHPADFLDNLRETQRLRLHAKSDSGSGSGGGSGADRAPPPLPPKPRPPPALV